MRAGLRCDGGAEPEYDDAAREIAEHILLKTGRPVLLSPARPEPDPSSSAMIACTEACRLGARSRPPCRYTLPGYCRPR